MERWHISGSALVSVMDRRVFTNGDRCYGPYTMRKQGDHHTQNWIFGAPDDQDDLLYILISGRIFSSQFLA